MKKGLLIFLYLFTVFFAACGKDTFSTSAEMMEALTEQYNVIGNIKEVGRITKDGALLLIGAVYYTNSQVMEYYAAEFSEGKNGRYQFAQRVTLAQDYQLGFGKWKDGYVIVCNHPDVSTIHFTLSANSKYREEDLEVTESPFVYFFDFPDFDAEPNYSMQIDWLDSSGNKIW